MTYFSYFPDCIYVAGHVRGTIYFISKKKTYHLSKVESNMVNDLVGKNSVEEVVEKYGSDAKKLVRWFIKKGFGTFCERPIFFESYAPHKALEIEGFFDLPPAMKVAYFQLSDACDAKCKFCHNNRFYNWQGCNSCIRWLKGGDKMHLTLKDIEKTISDLIDFNVPMVVFSGGNPLMDFDELIAISKRFKAANPGIKLKVYTNGKYFDEKIARTAKELGIIFVFSVFGTNEAEYDLTTGVPELYNCLNTAIALCKKFDIVYDVTLVIPMDLRDSYQKMHEFAVSLGGKNIFTTELILKQGNGGTIVSMPVGDRRVEDVDVDEYFRRKEGNFCLNGAVAIASNGSILPCPSWETIIGNIHNQEEDLRNVFRSYKITKFWDLTKNGTPACKECENRYACVDCSLLEWDTKNDISARQHFCNYNPELGEWL
jgi:radical SAM protein with 4Fe4S-binding SPASM domain